MTVIDDVKSRLDLVEVVTGYVPLLRSGRSFKANCPFHQEKTPSFYVFPDRQSWRCFGACATGGDAFSFIMKAENLEFAEALKRLAQQTGVVLPTRERRTEQTSSFQINEAAEEFFQQVLASKQGAGCRDYLKNRGLTEETVKKFGLGLSLPDGDSLLKHLTKLGFSPEQQATAGVVRSNDSGRFRDLFRGRLMIPIRNGAGELGGFGSRALDDSKPKYLNSPRTPVFDKGRILYALHLAKEAAREQGIVVAEGYMDAIMAHQHGFHNVVASMGTALTEHQVAEVRRLTSDVTMALDADVAGQQATLRSLESSWRVFQSREAGRAGGTTLFQRQDIPELKVAVLPEGKDPDEVIRESPEEWARLVREGVTLFEYLLPALCAQVDASTPQGKARVVELLFPFIAAVPEPIQQDHYFQLLASQLEISEDTLQASVGRFSARPNNDRNRSMTVRRPSTPRASEESSTAAALASANRDPVEEYCLALILQYPELGEQAAELKPEYFRRIENREVLSSLRRVIAAAAAEPAVTAYDQGKSKAELVTEEGDDEPGTESAGEPVVKPVVKSAAESLLESLKENVDQELAELVDSLAHKKLPPLDHRKQSVIQDALHRLEDRYLRELKVEEQMKFAEEPAEATEDLYQEALELNQRIKLNQAARGGLTPKAYHGR
jgi:DNA primase